MIITNLRLELCFRRIRQCLRLSSSSSGQPPQNRWRNYLRWTSPTKGFCIRWKWLLWWWTWWDEPTWPWWIWTRSSWKPISRQLWWSKPWTWKCQWTKRRSWWSHSSSLNANINKNTLKVKTSHSSPITRAWNLRRCIIFSHLGSRDQDPSTLYSIWSRKLLGAFLFIFMLLGQQKFSNLIIGS